MALWASIDIRGVRARSREEAPAAEVSIRVPGTRTRQKTRLLDPELLPIHLATLPAGAIMCNYGA